MKGKKETKNIPIRISATQTDIIGSFVAKNLDDIKGANAIKIAAKTKVRAALITNPAFTYLSDSLYFP